MTNDSPDTAAASASARSAATADLLRDARETSIFQMESPGMLRSAKGEAAELAMLEYLPSLTRLRTKPLND